MTLQTKYVLFTENKQVGHIQSAHWNKLPSPSSVWRVSSWDESFWSVVKVTCYQWVEEGEARKCKNSCFERRPPLLFCATSFLGSIPTKIIILDRLWMHLDVVTPPVENTWQSFSNNSFDELVLFFTKLLRISLLESTVARSHQDTPEIA